MSVVPDKISPEVGWRGWKVEDGLLRSPSHQAAWTPGTPFVASCQPGGSGGFYNTRIRFTPPPHYEWRLVAGSVPEGGVSLADYLPRESEWRGYAPSAPKVELPAGYTYALFCVQATPREAHGSCPGDNCSCGIYAASSPVDANVYAGHDDRVLGRVHLWGKVVPGEKGWRAEIAYPAEFFVIPKPGRMLRRRESHPLTRHLAKYGVPISVVETLGDIYEAALAPTTATATAVASKIETS